MSKRFHDVRSSKKMLSYGHKAGIGPFQNKTKPHVSFKVTDSEKQRLNRRIKERIKKL